MSLKSVTPTGVSHQGFCKLHKFAYCDLKVLFFWGGGGAFLLLVFFFFFFVIATVDATVSAYQNGEREAGTNYPCPGSE